MNSFARVARIALRYRGTVIASVICSFGIAFLWAANFTALMPVVDGVMEGKAMSGLVAEWISDTNEQIKSLDAEIETCRKQLKIAAEDAIEVKIGSLASRRESTERRLAIYEWALPIVTEWLPRTPFGTLLLICGFLMVSTFLKSLLRIWNSWLVAKLGNLTTLELRKEFYRRTLCLIPSMNSGLSG